MGYRLVIKGADFSQTGLMTSKVTYRRLYDYDGNLIVDGALTGDGIVSGDGVFVKMDGTIVKFGTQIATPWNNMISVEGFSSFSYRGLAVGNGNAGNEMSFVSFYDATKKLIGAYVRNNIDGTASVGGKYLGVINANLKEVVTFSGRIPAEAKYVVVSCSGNNREFGEGNRFEFTMEE